ncbi:hypothetical protein JHK87_020748 [Glycine soja]|nr:hypothetical protein JHK87_020748 [Glycine soja]
MYPSNLGGSGRGNRLNHATVSKLEAIFRECPYPNENRRRQISEELELSLNQVKFWFQNRKTKLKYERVYALLENNGVNTDLPLPSSSSYDTSGGRLLNPIVGLPSPYQHSHVLSTPGFNQDIPAPAPALDCYIPDPPSDDVALDYCIPTPASVLAVDHSIPALASDPWLGQDIPHLPTLATLDQDIPPLGQDTSTLPQDHMPKDLDQELDALRGILNNDLIFQSIINQRIDLDNAMMSQIANNAIEELIKLLDMNQPFWSIHDWKLVLKRDNYQSILGRRHCLPGPHARIESSKDSRIVDMNAEQLVQMFMNLINAEMHILSHLVPTRQFYFLRYCKQIKEGVWVIGDVSIDSLEYKTIVPRIWRRPSGCLIQEMNHGLCKVSWVEHVEVDDKMQTHQLFTDVICCNNAYGAERWLSTLKRMCERFACASAETIPSCDESGEGKKSVMHLAHRMVKTFCRTLDVSDCENFPYLTRMMNNGEVTIIVRKNNSEQDVPQGLILSAATSFLLPHSPENVFDFLIDNKKRAKWEPFWYGKPGHEIQRISTGNNPGNFISITKALGPSDNNMIVLQESYADGLGSMMVYSAFDTETMNFAMRGEDTSQLLVLPSGFTISGDGHSNAFEGQSRQVVSKGSLVTLMLQVLASSTPSMDMIDMEFVGSVTTLVSSTVEKIKAALNCSN